MGALRRSGVATVLLVVSCAPPPPATIAGPPPLDAGTNDVASVVAKAEPTYGPTSTAQIGDLDDHAWPPPKMSVSGGAVAGEGEWAAWQRPWLHTIEGAPPTFYTGFVRPDEKRSAKVEVVAMDARQLELDMAIGVEGPFPPDEKTAGKWPRHGGKLPREAAVATRVVAAWNGGFRFDQGKWGMSIRRREFQPPVADVASLLMFDDGRLGFGTWGPGMATPPAVRSLRQNLDPLVEDGVVDPRHRPKWGGILGAKKGQQAKRAGLCRTKGGHLLYLWGNDLEPHDLGEGMRRAGCDYGMHLDMNLYHVGFVFMSWDDAKYEKGKSEALSMAMGVAHTRYVHAPSPKEFFYATLRTPAPAGWAPDGGAQPAPTWSPAVTAHAAGPVRVTRFSAGRVRLAMVGGHLERDAKGQPLYLGAAPAPLAGDDLARVLAAVRLDLPATPHGLVLDGVAHRPLGAIGAALVAVEGTGRLALVPPGEASAARFQLEATPVVLGGVAVPTLPAVLDVAFGLDAQGNVLVADKTGLATPAALVEALVQAGCRIAVAPLGDKARFERAGRDTLYAGGTDTRLYLLARRPEPSTFRFDQDDQGTPRWPKVTTPVK